MADDGKIRPSDYLENDGTIEGIIRQLNDLIEVFTTFETEIKKSNFTDWLNKVKKGSDDEKTALSALTGVVERLISANENLIAVRSASYKELQKAEAVLKSEKRNIQQEIELQSKMASSYAYAKLQLSKLTEEWKNAANPADKAKIASQMERYASSVMVANKELKLMLNNFSALSTEQKMAYTNLEKQAAANDAVTASIKRRAKAQAELNEIMTNQGEVSMAALEEQMKKAVEERIALEAKELVLSDKRYASELSSAELIKQRIAIKEQLAEVEAKIKSLEMQENNDLSVLKARLAAKQQMLNKQAEILTATSAEGQMLAANEERLKRINRETELNAKLAVAVKGSYEYNKMLLEQQKNHLNSINLEKKVNLGLALAEIQATQQLIAEADYWTKLVSQQANAQAKINVLSDENYASEVQRTKELELELKYLQGMVDSRAKLAAMQKASTKDPATGKSQLEEIALNNELADSIKKTETARAQASKEAVQAYQQQVQAQQSVQKARLEAVAAMNVEESEADKLDKGTYAQLEARYKLLVMQVEQLNNGTDNYADRLVALTEKINAVGDALEKYEKAAGKSSSRMSSRQREWNGLTNSVYQLSRELPNLAVRADTFFLAISNNIPIFIDEFKRAKRELGSFNKALAETGKAFAKSIPLAVILLALSKWSDLVKIWDKLFNTMEDGTLKVGAFYRAMEEHAANASSSVVKQIYNIRMLSTEWKKLSDIKDREDFLVKYREELDKTGLAIKDVNDAESVFSTNTNIIIEAYIARAKAAAAGALAEEHYKEAVEKAIAVERKAAAHTGKDWSLSDMRQAFAARFGITDENQIKSGKFVVNYRQLRSISSATYDAPFAQNIKEVVKLRELEAAAKEGDLIELPKGLAEWLAVASDAGERSRDVISAIRGMYEALTAGDQAADKAAQYLEDFTEALNKAGVGTTDLRKKLDSFDLKSLKALNDSLTNLMNNAAYSRGGIKANMPTFNLDEKGEVVQSSKKATVKSSFDKSRFTANLSLQETLKQYQNDINELERMRAGASEKEQQDIDALIARYKKASINAVKSVADTLTEIQLQETATMAKLNADSIQLKLTAVKEGSKEEQTLRLQLIQSNMEAELAENALKEKALQQSESAIRAKYQRETEQAEREWAIKQNDWRIQQLETANSAELKSSEEYFNRRKEIIALELDSELKEKAELIENGLITEQEIEAKYADKLVKLFKERREAIIADEKALWNALSEVAETDSTEWLAAQKHLRDLELEQSLGEQQDILNSYSERIATLNSQLDFTVDLTEDEIAAIKKEIENYEELSEQVKRYMELLTKLNKKQENRAAAELGLRKLGHVQTATSAKFYMDNPQAGERESALFELRQEKELLTYRLENADALGLSHEELLAIDQQLQAIKKKEEDISGFKGLMSSIASHGIIGAIDMSTEQYDAVNIAINSVKDSLNELMEAYTAAAQAAYDAAQAQVEAAQTVYETELQARANGYANDVEGAKKELELEKKKAKEKEALLKKSQKAQEAVNTAMQISNLITGTSQILAAFAEVPVVAGILIATMWGMFALTKIKASQLASESSTYGEGGYEEAVGGSHASGHDIKTGIKTKSGKRMVIEGGEGVGVFSRAAVAKYGDAIPALVDDINSGRLSAFDGNDFADNDALLRSAYAREVMTSQPMTNNIDLTVIEGMLYAIVRGRNNGQPVVLQDGSIMERKGNRTIITRK